MCIFKCLYLFIQQVTWSLQSAAHESSGANSVMIARGALANASIFRPEGMLPQFEVAQEYVKMAVQYDNVFQNTKWFLTNMLRTMMKEPFGQRITKAKTTEEFCDLFDIQDYYQETL